MVGTGWCVLLGCYSKWLYGWQSVPCRACYIAILLYICSFVVLGVALQNHLSVGVLVMEWGIAQVAIMVNMVAVCMLLFPSSVLSFFAKIQLKAPLVLDAYLNDCFLKHQGKISMLVNLMHVLGGFSVVCFQVPWAAKNRALQTFGCEAAYVVFFSEPCRSYDTLTSCIIS